MAANPSIQLGTDGNWAIKEDNLLAYKKDGTRFFNKEFDFARNTTATFVDKDGFIKESATNTPRIDFTDDATGHLLLEPQSTNLLPYSEDFTQWFQPNANVVLTSNKAPNGTTNSVYNLTGTAANLYYSGTINVEHTISFYIKSNGQGKDKFKLRLGNNTSVEYTATNEWVRYEFTSTPTTSVFGITTSSAPNNEFDLLIWGAQSEQLSYATSYIPTSGSTATRNADVCINSGSAQDFNSEEGVLYAEIAALVDDGTNKTISISDGTTNNRVNILYSTSSNRIRAIVKENNITSFDSEYTVSSTLEFHKCAVRYKENNFSFWIDGVQISTDTSGNEPVGLNELAFDSGSGSPFYGKTKNLKVFKRAMSNGELYLLTVPQYQSYQEMATALNYTL